MSVSHGSTTKLSQFYKSWICQWQYSSQLETSLKKNPYQLPLQAYQHLLSTLRHNNRQNKQ